MTTARHRARQLRRDLIEAGREDLAHKVLPAAHGVGVVDWNYGLTLDDMNTLAEMQNARWPGSVWIECLPCWAPTNVGPGAALDVQCVRSGGCPHGCDVRNSWDDTRRVKP